MGNRIKLDGTTNSSFQIGKDGLVIDGTSNVQSGAMVLTAEGSAQIVDIGLVANSVVGTTIDLSDIDEGGCGYAGTVTTDQPGSIGLGFQSLAAGEEFWNLVGVGDTFILDDHLSGRYGEGFSSSRWEITVTIKDTPYGTGDYTYIQIDFDVAVRVGDAQGTGTYNYVGTDSVTTYKVGTLEADVANVKIQGGTSGQVLSTDGSGNLTWVDQGGTPPGPTVSIVTDTFEGDDVTTSFFLNTVPALNEDCLVFLAGELQDPNTAYSLIGSELMFNAAPGTGQAIVVKTISGDTWVIDEFTTDYESPNPLVLSVIPASISELVVVATSTLFDSSNYDLVQDELSIVNNYPNIQTVKVYIAQHTVPVPQPLIGNTSANITSLGINQGLGAVAFDSVIIGDGAGANVGGTSYVIIGQNAGQGITTEGGIIAIGQGAASGGGPIGAFNTIIGLNAGTNMQGLMNFALGTDSAQNVHGWYCIGIGTEALGYSSDNTGYYNIGLGRDAGKGMTGANSICIGSYAGTNTDGFTLGDNMIVVGVNAMPFNSGETNKTYIGNDATEDTYLRGNVHSSGSVNGTDATFTGNVSVTQMFTVGNYDASTLAGITGTIGQIVAVNDNGGKLAYWDTTNERWSYVFDNSAVNV